MREVKVALVAGLALLVVGIGVALARSPMSVARKNGTFKEEARLASVSHGTTFCQAHELLPGGTSAIRLTWFAFTGPRVRLVVYSHGRVITGGEHESGWTARALTIPVRPLAHAVSDVTVCGSFHMHDEELTVFGTPGHGNARGKLWIEYLRPGTRSWASLVPSILSHMGFGRASSGPGIVLVALAALAAVIVLASNLVLRELP